MSDFKKVLIVLAMVVAGAALSSHNQRPDLFLSNQLNRLGNNFFTQNLFSDYSSQAMPAVDSQATQTIADQVTPSVVSIYGRSVIQQQDSGALSGLLPFFHGLVSPDLSSTSDVIKTTAGTGFFIDSSGYILTNNHVVSDSGAKFTVDLSDGSEQPATIVYRDPSHDLAILKIPGSNYPALSLGDSSGVNVGESVVSIGNALGQYHNAVSTGRVMALHQSIMAQSDDGADETLNDVIEINAQLYPGDSGGPTVDSSGKVIGVNVAMSTDQNNDGFSVPINYAKSDISAVLGGRGQQ